MSLANRVKWLFSKEKPCTTRTRHGHDLEHLYSSVHYYVCVCKVCGSRFRVSSFGVEKQPIK